VRVRVTARGSRVRRAAARAARTPPQAGGLARAGGAGRGAGPGEEPVRGEAARDVTGK